MSKIVQADNINAGQYYLNGQPLTTGGGGPHTMLPVGSIIMWPTSSPPSNWLLCNGGAVPSSRPLHAMMKTLPDFRGRFPAMAGDPGGSGSYIESLKTATDTSNISISQIPSHKHDITVHWGGEDGMETATSDTNSFDAWLGGDGGVNSVIGSGQYNKGPNDTKTPNKITFGEGPTAAATGTNKTGGDEPYAPPYYSINFIIYAGAPTS